MHRLKSKEVYIIRTSAPIHIVVHYPKTEEGKHELRKRVADVHADMVNRYIQKLNCPSTQKIELLDAIIATATKEKAGEKTE